MRKGRRFVNLVYYSSKTVHFGHKILHFSKKQIMTPHIMTFNCRLLINPNYITVDDHQEHIFFLYHFWYESNLSPTQTIRTSLCWLVHLMSHLHFLTEYRHGSISVFTVLRKCDEFFFRIIQALRTFRGKHSTGPLKKLAPSTYRSPFIQHP